VVVCISGIRLYVYCADCSTSVCVCVCYGCCKEKQFAIYSPAFLDPLPRSVRSFMRVRSSSSGNKNGRLLGCRRSCSPHSRFLPPLRQNQTLPPVPERRYYWTWCAETTAGKSTSDLPLQHHLVPATTRPLRLQRPAVKRIG